MIDEKSSDDFVLTDAQMREVIERATRELPPASGITVAELRRIAGELDIDPISLERALDQVISLPVAGQPIRNWLRRHLTTLGHLVDPLLPNKGRLVGGALLGGIAGWLNAFLMSLAMQGHYPIALIMVGFTLANVLSRRLDRGLARFLAETYVMWGAYAAFWAGTYGDVTENLVLWVALWTSAATVLGWLLMRGPSGGGAHPSLPAPDSETGGGTSTDTNHTLRESLSLPGLIWVGALRMSRA